MAGRYFGIPFAATGDKTVTPDAVQPDGSVSMSVGFGFDYERPNTDPAYKPVPRPGMNGLLHDITEAVGIIQKQGFADWDIAAAPYQLNAQVRHVGEVWLSNVANNNSTPGSNSDWRSARNSRGGYVAIAAPGVTNWAVPSELQQGLAFAKVTLYGGGAGGARRSTAPGPSGGGGGGIAVIIVDLTGVVSVAITIGAGGIGGAADPSNGANGGASNFGGMFSAQGGQGGPSGASPAAAPGGVGVGGLSNQSVGTGQIAIAAPGGGVYGGAGGGMESPFGSSGTGTPGGFGQGGAGRTAAAGVNGANGAVVIEW